MTVSTNMQTGRMNRVSKTKITEGEKTVYRRIKAFVGKKANSIYVHDLGNSVFSIDIYGEEFNKYGFNSVGTQIMYSNVLRFIFQDIEIDDMEVGFYKIGGI
ncbi:MAG: hypothetical protein WC917_03040 [Bacilli bacterium]|jgi:hypothetical protein